MIFADEFLRTAGDERVIVYNDAGLQFAWELGDNCCLAHTGLDADQFKKILLSGVSHDMMSVGGSIKHNGQNRTNKVPGKKRIRASVSD